MKKKLTIVLVVAVLLACAIFGIAGANNDKKVTVLFNGTEIVFDDAAPPVWKNHQLMVELETIMDKLMSSAKVQDTGIIQCMREFDKLTLMLDSDVVNLKNEIIKMEVPVFQLGEIIYVPLQFVVEAYGGVYSWDESTYTAEATIADAAMKPMKYFNKMIMPYDDLDTVGVDGITVSADEQAAYGAFKDNVIDGDYNTRWSAPNKGSTDTPDGALYQTMTWDLGKEVRVSGAGFHWYYNNGRDYDFAVEVSTDGENWTEVIARRTSMRTDTLESFGWDSLDEITARYVKVVCYGDTTKHWSHITEMRVFCPDDESNARDYDLQ